MAFITEKTCKTFLNPSGIPGCDLAANPYVGCEHACVYCYAKFMKRFTGHDEPWGTFVDVRTNAAEAAAKQLRNGKLRGRSVMIGTVTDAWQPAEKKYRIMRELLPLFAENGLRVSVLTKSSLVLRDVDLLSAMGDVEVGMTITGTDERARKAFEPGASPYEERWIALEELAERGVKTYAFIGPALPGVTDRDIGALLERLRKSRARHAYFDGLNYAPQNLPGLLKAARSVCPDSVNAYRNHPEREAESLRARVEAFAREKGMECQILF